MSRESSKFVSLPIAFDGNGAGSEAKGATSHIDEKCAVVIDGFGDAGVFDVAFGKANGLPDGEVVLPVGVQDVIGGLLNPCVEAVH